MTEFKFFKKIDLRWLFMPPFALAAKLEQKKKKTWVRTLFKVGKQAEQ